MSESKKKKVDISKLEFSVEPNESFKPEDQKNMQSLSKIQLQIGDSQSIDQDFDEIQVPNLNQDDEHDGLFTKFQ